MTKELEERNYYISLFNTNEPIIERAIRKYKIELKNPFSIARRKIQELEMFFSNRGKEYYAGTVIGSILADHVLKSTADSMELAASVMDFENHIMFSSFRLPIKNPHLMAYQESLNKIEGIAVDENLSQILGDSLTKIQFLEKLLDLSHELRELVSPEFAERVLIKAYRIIEEKESNISLVSPQKVIKH